MYFKFSIFFHSKEQQKQQQLQLKLKQDALRKQQILLEVQHQPNNININNKQGSKTGKIYLFVR